MVVVNFSGPWAGDVQLELWSDWNVQKPEQNATLFNVQVRLISSGGGQIFSGNGGKRLWLNVGGIEEHYDIDPVIGKNQKRNIFGKDYLIPHNPDGTKTITVSCEYVVNLGGYGTAKAQFTVKLKDIFKGSKGKDVSGTIGSPVTLSVDRNDTRYTHAVEAEFGSWKQNINGDSRFVSTYNWTPPMELCMQVPNSDKGVGKVRYITYQNGKEIARDEKNLTLAVPASVKPTLSSFSVRDTNTAVNNLLGDNKFVSVLSNLKVDFSKGTGAYGSTISSYSATIVGKPNSTYNEDGVIGSIEMVGNAVVEATVTDSRGRTSEPKRVSIEFLDYFLPQISFEAKRVGANGEQIQVIRNAKVAPLPMNGSQRNTMRISFKVAPFGSNTFSENNGPANTMFTSISQITNSAANLDGTFSSGSSYVIIGTVQDKFTSSEFRVEVPTRSVLMSMDQTGVGIGKIRERGVLDVAGDVYASGQLNVNGIRVANKNIQQYPLTSLEGRIQDVRWSRKDLNTITETGLYMVFGKQGGAKNGPDTQKQGMLEVYALNHKEVFQRYLDDRLNTWIRWRDWGNNWSDWEQTYVCKADIPAPVVEKPKFIHKDFTDNIPYKLPATITRSGDLVTIHIPRTIKTIVQRVENFLCPETIPVGFRPTNVATMILALNESANFLGNAMYYLHPDGTIRITTGITKTAVYTGSITYITTDPFPDK
nr:MAG TPA: protein of unknown function DUF859 [Caudoviricetes sp.]